MSKKLIRLITAESDYNSADTIFIGGTKEYPYLAYNKQIGQETGTVIVSTYKKSPFRPIHCSELYNKLKKRSWNKVDGCRFIITTPEGEKLYYRAYDSDSSDSLAQSEGPIDTLSTKVIGESGELSQIGSNFTFEIVGEDYADSKEISNTYKELFGDMATKIDEINIYNAATRTINITDEIYCIDLISYGSDVYTDTVSLVPFISNSSKSNITCSADITIQYSKSGNIYNHDTTLLAFSFEKEGNNEVSDKLSMDNYIEDINGDVRLEYINGTIRVFPNNENITECILSSCSIRYGK